MMVRKLFFILLFTIVLLPALQPVHALEPMPSTAGFSGFVRPGYGYLDIKSNMVAKISRFDLSKRTINSRNSSPRSESTGIINLPFRLAYTFNNLKTQVFLGSDVIDLVRFDINQQIAIKQQINGFGMLQAGLLFSSIVTEVWKDPYLENKRRSKTDRDVMGIRLVWDRIMDSDFELTYTYRDIDIDHDRSGRSVVGLTSSQMKLLKRDSDEHSIQLLYSFKIRPQHRVEPSFTYRYDDRDGDARKNDQYVFKLTYAYLGDPFTLTFNGEIGWADYDKRNPIYREKQNDDIYGANLALFYRNPWGWRLAGSRPMNFFLLGAYYKRDADISFYDEKTSMISAGVIFRW